MAIENATYASESSYNGSKKPMVVASSGGSGHITAAQGLIQHLQHSSSGNIIFTEYNPVLSTDNPPSPIQTTIERAIKLMHTPYAGPLLQTIVNFTPYPTLPTQENLNLEVELLNKNQERNGKRLFIDMLLDVCPAGHISIAIWNEQFRNNQIKNLKKLLALQSTSNEKQYSAVYNYFLEQLQTAANNDIPYTELISTQAMALPALCDAVKTYNQWLKANQLPYPKVILHQYMTDLPTKGAVHFLTPLAHLAAEQQKQMKLYAVGLNEKVLSHFFPKGYQFTGVYNISAKENPMIRAGFKDPSLDNSTKFHLDTEITVKWYDEEITEKVFLVKANESIASIMLGSQIGRDIAEYIETLLENGFDKVFIFGNNEAITQKIAQIKKKKEYADKEIISLGSQSAEEIASLMTRSNLVIIRGGGLSIMEQLAMPHNPGQIILIHNANAAANQPLTSGLSWEDGNVHKLIADLDKKNIYVKKTSTELAKQQISEAKLITALKVLTITKEEQSELKKLILTMPPKTRSLFANLLNSTYLKENPQELQRFLLAYDQIGRPGKLGKNVSSVTRNTWLTALSLSLWENKLEQTAKYFYTPLKHESFFNMEYLRVLLIGIAYHPTFSQLTKNDLLIRNSLSRPLFSAINKRNLNDREAQEKIANQFTKLLLTISDKKMLTRYLVSEDNLANLLKNGLLFLKIKYPLAFQKGSKEVFEAKKSFSIFQKLIFLIKHLLSKLIGKKKENNSPALSTMVTPLNTDVPTIKLQNEQQKNSRNQMRSRYSFHQVPADNNETNHHPRLPSDQPIHRASP